MSRQVSVAEAKNNLPALLHDTENGAAVEITRRGSPVAVLLSISEYERLSHSKPDLWEAIQRFRFEHDLTDFDPDEVFGSARDPSSGRDFKW